MIANETLLRNAYAAFTRGDIPGFLRLCTPDLTFAVPGDGLLAGRHTRDHFLEILGGAMQAVAGSFREEIVSLLAGDDSGAVMARQSAERDGKLHQWNAVHWWRIRDGKLAEFHEFVDDPAAFERAWHR